MYTKSECKNLIKQLSVETGFIHPSSMTTTIKGNLKNDKSSFDPTTKKIEITPCKTGCCGETECNTFKVE